MDQVGVDGALAALQIGLRNMADQMEALEAAAIQAQNALTGPIGKKNLKKLDRLLKPFITASNHQIKIGIRAVESTEGLLSTLRELKMLQDTSGIGS